MKSTRTLHHIAELGAAGRLRRRPRDRGLLLGFRKLFHRNGAVLELNEAPLARGTWSRFARELAPDGDSIIISSFRVPRAVVARLDAWIDEQNEGRRGPKLTRNDVIRGLMDWASEEKPNWEARR